RHARADLREQRPLASRRGGDLVVPRHLPTREHLDRGDGRLRRRRALPSRRRSGEIVPARVRRPLLFLFGAVDVVLVLACANPSWRGGERNASWCSSAGRCLTRTRSRSRTREFAIRVALGADGRSVARLVLGHGVRITALGLVAGFVAVVLVAPLLRMLPVTVRPPELFTIVPVALLIGAVGVGASLIPAGRGRPANPLQQLK